jgi:hypothetical protein
MIRDERITHLAVALQQQDWRLEVNQNRLFTVIEGEAEDQNSDEERLGTSASSRNTNWRLALSSPSQNTIRGCWSVYLGANRSIVPSELVCAVRPRGRANKGRPFRFRAGTGQARARLNFFCRIHVHKYGASQNYGPCALAQVALLQACKLHQSIERLERPCAPLKKGQTVTLVRPTREIKHSVALFISPSS